MASLWQINSGNHMIFMLYYLCGRFSGQNLRQHDRLYRVYALGKPLFDPLEEYYFARVLNLMQYQAAASWPLEEYYFARVLNRLKKSRQVNRPLEEYYFARVLNSAPS